MSVLSWRWPFRRRGSASSEEKKGSSDDESIMEEFGVTKQLCEFVRGFNVSTFKDFSLQDRSEEPISATLTSNVREDLTEWQERHASLVLSKVKEISQLRYTMCPRLLKEQEFWRIYFVLVKTYMTPYEIRALQKAKIKKISSEDNTSAKTSGMLKICVFSAVLEPDNFSKWRLEHRCYSEAISGIKLLLQSIH